MEKLPDVGSNKRIAALSAAGLLVVLSAFYVGPNTYQMVGENSKIADNRPSATKYVRGVLGITLGDKSLYTRTEESPDCEWLTWPTNKARECAIEGTVQYLYENASVEDATKNAEEKLGAKGISYRHAYATWEEPSPETNINAGGRTLPGGTLVGSMDGKRYRELHPDASSEINNNSAIITIEAYAFALVRPEVIEGDPCDPRCK